MNDNTLLVPVKIERTYRVPVDDIEVLIEMAGYGIGYWALSAHSDVEAQEYTVEGENPENEGTLTMTVTYQELAETLVKLAIEQENDTVETYLALLMSGHADAGLFDSELADVVVQMAMFGEVVFG